MPEQFCIFIVDADAAHKQLIFQYLDDSEFEVYPFASSDECLAALPLQPNLILLDMKLSIEGGLETCRAIRAIDDEVQIVLLVDHEVPDDSISELLLKTYQAGGNDFIHKYAHKQLLLRKIHAAVENLEHKKQLQNQLNDAQKMAFMVLSNLGEVGNVLHFMRALNACRNEPEIGKLLLDTLREFNLKTLVKLDDDRGGEYYFCSDVNCTPVEFSILGYVAKKGRISLSGERLALNYPHVIMLVIGLDLNDQDNIGRIRDHLAMIAEAAGIRIDALTLERQRLQLMNDRLNDARELNRLLTEMEEHQQISQLATQQTSDAFRVNMENLFMFLGLTENQELQLHGLLNNFLDDLHRQLQEDVGFSEKLSTLLDRQRSLLAEN